MDQEQLVKIKAAQREGWSLFAPLEIVTSTCAPNLLRFSQAKAGQTLLDVGCGTGVVAVTAAQQGLKVSGIDLSPVLIERAQFNCELAQLKIDLREGDVEALPFKDASFDNVVSQFGHMFAPRPSVAISEMLRVLKPGGTIAFSTWPPHLYVGKMFDLVAKFAPPPPGVPKASAWGEPGFIRDALGDKVDNLCFDTGLMNFAAMSIGHCIHSVETTVGPVVKLVQNADAATLKAFREEFRKLAEPYFSDNNMRQHYLMTRAIKK